MLFKNQCYLFFQGNRRIQELEEKIERIGREYEEVRVILKSIICLNDCQNEELVNYLERDNIGYFTNIKLSSWSELLASTARKLSALLLEYP